MKKSKVEISLVHFSQFRVIRRMGITLMCFILVLGISQVMLPIFP
jgi:hypothetical protein